MLLQNIYFSLITQYFASYTDIHDNRKIETVMCKYRVQYYAEVRKELDNL